MPKAQPVTNTNINKVISESTDRKVVSIVPEPKDKLPDTIAIPSIAPIPESPTHVTRRHSITLDLDDLYLMRKDLGNKAYVLLLLLVEFGVDEMLSGHKQEIDIFSFAKRHNLEPEDVHKGIVSIRNISLAGNQLKIPFTYTPPTDED